MRRVGQARRRDLNEPAIVQALRQIGADVLQVSGKGAPDLLVRWQGKVFGLEVKTATGKRTEAQEDSQWPIVRSPEEAIQAVTGR